MFRVGAFLLFSCSLLLTACTTSLSPAAAMIQDADERMVSQCKFIGALEGSSGFGNMSAGIGMTNSKNEVREEAAKRSATHVVWRSIQGGEMPFATGLAYACNKAS